MGVGVARKWPSAHQARAVLIQRAVPAGWRVLCTLKRRRRRRLEEKVCAHGLELEFVVEKATRIAQAG